jgi:uncharacterized protein with GYD domain
LSPAFLKTAAGETKTRCSAASQASFALFAFANSPGRAGGLGSRAATTGRRGLEEAVMASYILLANYSEQGLKSIKDTVKRTQAGRELAKKAGITMQASYWTLGQYDVVAMFEAADDESMTAFALSIAKLGNVKTQTLRAFSAKEMTAILGKMV